MTAIPTTKYTRGGDAHIAYQVVGEGPHDLVLVPGWVSHVEHVWEEPAVSHFLRRLASFSRLILLDRRGTGLSDRVTGLPTLEQRMDDIRAVMDAAGSEQAALFGISESGPMCLMFAATYPARTRALVLLNTFARMLRAPDYPIGLPDEVLEKFLERIEETWGTGTISANLFNPSVAHDERFRQSWARIERFAVSPGGMKALMRMLHETDARHALSAIRVPTLIVHREGDQIARVEGGRYIAEHIHGAKYVQLPGNDHFAWVGNTDSILDEVEEFLTGARHTSDTERILATVMFSDIVDATRSRCLSWATAAGVTCFRRSNRRSARELARFRGRAVKTMGDGFLATFDGPARGIRCATAIRDAARAQFGLEIRSGLHTGEIEVIGNDVGGIAVHIGARVGASARPGEVLVSGTVKDLVVGSGIPFEDRGERELKGVPGERRLYAVVSG